MAMTESQNELSYEKNQRFNWLVSWLHSLRYAHILGVFGKLAKNTNGRPIKVVELGCAHAKLYNLLNSRFKIEYLGIEIRKEFAEAALARYGANLNFKLVQGSATEKEAMNGLGMPDIVVALETLEHIPEHDVVRIVENIARLSPPLFVCSVPVEIGPIIWIKNVGSWLMGYSRHKEYRWRDTFWAGFYGLDRLPPHETRHLGFDWRWLAQTIRHNMRIVETRKLPFQILPAALTTSVFFIAEPRSDDGRTPPIV